MADGMNGRGFELLDSLSEQGSSMPDAPVPDHPELTLPEGARVTIDNHSFKADSISVAALYLNKDDAGEMIRLQIDYGVEGVLVTVRADDRVIGGSFNPMSEILSASEIAQAVPVMASKITDSHENDPDNTPNIAL